MRNVQTFIVRSRLTGKLVGRFQAELAVDVEQHLVRKGYSPSEIRVLNARWAS